MKTAKKEFILKAHKDACEDYKLGIEKHWPELFPKQEFKVGDWVYYKVRPINKVRRIAHIKYGQRHTLCFADDMIGREYNAWNPRNFRKATKEEIEAHLIAEAKKRGYKEGVVIDKSCWFPSETRKVIPKTSFRYAPDQLIMAGETVYAMGQWAEIIDQTPKDLQDLICKYGKEKIKEWL